MIYEIFNQKHLQENAITIMIVKAISTDIRDHKGVLLMQWQTKEYIYAIAHIP